MLDIDRSFPIVEVEFERKMQQTVNEYMSIPLYEGQYTNVMVNFYRQIGSDGVILGAKNTNEMLRTLILSPNENVDEENRGKWYIASVALILFSSFYNIY